MKFFSTLRTVTKTAFSAALSQLHKAPAVKSAKQLVSDHSLTLTGLTAIATSAYMYNHVLGVFVAGVLTLVFNERVSY